MEDLLAYAGLFAAAFLAATLLPAQSEALLVALLYTERFPVLLLLLAASAGNVLGSCVNYWLGRLLAGNARFIAFAGEAKLARAEAWYRRYGRWSLLASWLPVVGDPLTLLAGTLREPFAYFLALVTLAKTGRYLALIAAQQAWFS